ncbi:MAG: hypothetical protein WAZ77_19795 [Candidatus Nitrosopolaris sp.]
MANRVQVAAATEYAYSQGVFVTQFCETAIYCNKISFGIDQTKYLLE